MIDSLGLFQIVGFLETEYGIMIEDAMLTPEKFATINSIVQLIESSKPADGTADQYTGQAAS